MLETGPKDSAKRSGLWYAYAHEVLRELESFVPPLVPLRPATVPETDVECFKLLDFVRRNTGAAIPSDRKEAARDLDEWRMAVWRAEEGARGMLGCVLRAQRAIEQVSEGDAQLEDERAQLRQHVRRHFGVDVAVVPGEAALADLVARSCRDTKVCATALVQGRVRRVQP